MTTTLIILAHPEPQSFNGAWAQASRQAAIDAGHQVLFSDLTAMGFDAVERASHYPASDKFDPLKAQELAVDAPPADVAGEIEKLEMADLIVFHFPIWWFAPPAVLKGWFDRVLLHGRVHTIEERFGNGKFRGKHALFCVTAGATAEECGPDGKEGDIHLQLWPSAQTLNYLGFTILKPMIEFGVHGYHQGRDKNVLEARLSQTLARQSSVISSFHKREVWPFNLDTDFDATGRLKPKAPSHSAFIRHRS